MSVDTGGAPWWLPVYLIVTFVVGAVAWFRWRGRVTEQLDEGVPMGTFGGLRLSVVYQQGEGRRVALVFVRLSFGRLDMVILTPTHARQLAESLRDAAGRKREGTRPPLQ